MMVMVRGGKVIGVEVVGSNVIHIGCGAGGNGGGSKGSISFGGKVLWWRW